MKNFSTLIIICLSITGCTISVPYFDDLKPEYVCGGYNEYCQPTSSTQWSKIKNGIDYNGNPNHFLGRSYSNFFQTEKCVTQTIEDSNLDVNGVNVIQGSLKKEEQNQFSSQISANIIQLIQELGSTLPPALKADLQTELQHNVENLDTNTITLEYKRIDLDKDFIDNHIDDCLQTIASSKYVATGMSLLTVSGTWSSKNVVDIMANVELKASYQALTADAKNKYTQAKTRILNGEFQPLSFIFAIAYRKGTLDS